MDQPRPLLSFPSENSREGERAKQPDDDRERNERKGNPLPFNLAGDIVGQLRVSRTVVLAVRPLPLRRQFIRSTRHP